VGGALARLGHSLTCVKIWGCSTLYGPEYGLPKKLTWVGMISLLKIHDYWTKVHQTYFTPILNIFILSEDIRCRSLKLTEIGLNFAYF